MIAVILVRDGALPAGFDEAICEADRRALLIGSNVAQAVADVQTLARTVWTLEIDPANLPMSVVAAAVADCLGHIDTPSSAAARTGESVVVPASPDGRDLAPHLAIALDRQLYAGATSIAVNAVTVSRRGGLYLTDIHPHEPFVATLQIGVRGADARDDLDRLATNVIDLVDVVSVPVVRRSSSVEHVEVQPPDASTMDLAEAPRILGGGAGLDDAEAFDQLQRVAARLGASMGVTRVITDRGWAEHTRQIGTTGVVVDPELYISFGISGAVQHTSGLGDPEHIISVNTDAHCPMMQISDVAIVADANAVLDALESLLLDARVGDV